MSRAAPLLRSPLPGLLALALTLGACAAPAPPADSAASEDAWWELEGEGGGSSSPDPPAEGRGDALEAILSGELRYDGVRWDGLAGVKAQSGDALLCQLDFGLPQSGAATGCAPCALQLAVTVVDLVVEEDAGCARVGIDPDAFVDATWSLGFEDEVLWREGDDGWAAVGAAWLAGEAWTFEILLQDGDAEGPPPRPSGAR